MTVVISNSEGETYNTCRRQHYYKFALGLMPKRANIFIRIGVVGHKVLETYYRAALETNGDKKAMYLAAMEEIAHMLSKAEDEQEIEVIELVSSRILSYCRFYKADMDSWRVIDVEGKYLMPLTDRITYGLTLDLLVEVTNGPWRGQCLVIDHKWCYNFHSAEELDMNSQIPKYILALKHQGFNVKRGMLNQIRYRGGGDTEAAKLFRRSVITPSDVRLNSIMNEQLNVSKEVLRHVEMPVKDYKEVAYRSISKRNCGMCSFRLPCSLELDGRDREATEVLALDYVANDYGYRG